MTDLAAADLTCPDCGAPMVLKRSPQWGQFYGCSAYPRCRATHSAHPDGRPLGVPADAATRAARIDAHAAFDSLWKEGVTGSRPKRRSAAYAELAAALNLTHHDCHIGQMTAEQCAQVVAYVRAKQAGLDSASQTR